ncbi:MAG: pyridoxal 5'-phosphate synthase lyase subunit PdxS, partial [Metallosphaera sp.]
MRLYALSFEEIERFFYKLAELRDSVKDEGLMSYVPEISVVSGTVQGSTRVKHAFPIFQKGGVVMDVTNVEQAGIAED